MIYLPRYLPTLLISIPYASVIYYYRLISFYFLPLPLVVFPHLPSLHESNRQVGRSNVASVEANKVHKKAIGVDVAMVTSSSSSSFQKSSEVTLKRTSVC